jgi:hypothetical protein
VTVFGDFFLIEREGDEPVRGERLAFGETNGRNEAWLRDTLFDHPELLPVKDIDPAYGPLTPLCTELRTEAGPLDIAFINPFGRLTLVECKLWRNPQARREVVAQVLDYARAISRWSYSDLQRQVSAASGRTGNAPYELVKASHPDLVEHEFVDAAAAALRSGRFLLLIAGDGIREDVGALSELINNNAAMGFSFGLVEVALYGFGDGSLAIQPRAIAKTRIMEKTVVVLRDPGGASMAADIDIPPLGSTTPPSQRPNLGEGEKQAEYREWYRPIVEMTFDDPDQEPPKLYYPNNIRVHLPWPKTWLLAGSAASGRKCFVVLIEGGQGNSLTPLLGKLRDEILAQLPSGAFARGRENGVTFEIERPWSSFADEEAKKAWIAENLNAFVNVFRPLLKDLAKVEAG